jgi:hypothetical protein
MKRKSQVCDLEILGRFYFIHRGLYVGSFAGATSKSWGTLIPLPLFLFEDVEVMIA